MEFMTPKSIYTIELPINTSKEVFEWFETMDKANQLSVEVIELVYKNIQSYNITKPNFKNINPDEQINIIDDKQSDIHNTFINNLYNWQESTSAIFKEVNSVKKEKKKMLCI